MGCARLGAGVGGMAVAQGAGVDVTPVDVLRPSFCNGSADPLSTTIPGTAVGKENAWLDSGIHPADKITRHDITISASRITRI